MAEDGGWEESASAVERVRSAESICWVLVFPFTGRASSQPLCDSISLPESMPHLHYHNAPGRQGLGVGGHHPFFPLPLLTDGDTWSVRDKMRVNPSFPGSIFGNPSIQPIQEEELADKSLGGKGRRARFCRWSHIWFNMFSRGIKVMRYRKLSRCIWSYVIPVVTWCFKYGQLQL